MLKVKEAPRVTVRIPQWTDHSRVNCRVNGRRQDLEWRGNYMKLKGLKRGDQVTVEFPMRETTLFKEIGEVPYNTRPEARTLAVTFRVAGEPEICAPSTGRVKPCFRFERQGQRTRVRLKMERHEGVILSFAPAGGQTGRRGGQSGRGHLSRTRRGFR